MFIPYTADGLPTVRMGVFASGVPFLVSRGKGACLHLPCPHSQRLTKHKTCLVLGNNALAQHRHSCQAVQSATVRHFNFQKATQPYTLWAL